MRRAYPSDLDDDLYHFVVIYLVLKPDHAAQRRYPLREVLNALLYVTKTGTPWAYLPMISRRIKSSMNKRYDGVNGVVSRHYFMISGFWFEQRR